MLLKSSKDLVGTSRHTLATIPLSAWPSPSCRKVVAPASVQPCRQLAHSNVCDICATSFIETGIDADDRSAIDLCVVAGPRTALLQWMMYRCRVNGRAAYDTLAEVCFALIVVAVSICQPLKTSGTCSDRGSRWAAIQGGS